MTREELDDLPLAIDLRTAALVLGISRTTAYELVRTGRWPTRVLRLGSRIRIPTEALKEVLELSTDRSDLNPPAA